ncbi:MAG: hypothetical protein GTN62_08460 [Gemmatimonadales bacterium]|nr:hypothetical protein [Gemmatimonadales bacterium]NIN50130.1 hypothetical protein [Gemmatimonadales bacterium]NIP07594.1 hypothetical protein [Gemmatimonadales bacterium]NIR01746.1 hypothetical protein [Gemmatimonadales bacterium]NIS65649.1 hypothetical protein [Gemmatimonadales bacterium]
MAGGTSTKKRARVWALIVALAVFGGALIYGSISVVQAECELCVEFRGQTTCRRGSGATEEDARRAAQRAACAVMARGMDESIACDNTPPTNVRCPAD